MRRLNPFHPKHREDLASNPVWGRVAKLARTQTGLEQPLGVDLLVLTTHGRTGLRHMLMGSVAEKIVRHASCSVLVVRPEERDFLG
ncbi:MAG: universal stress protein [Pedosphaera sp.]|nr:universal stress protein [Pedosphaera sp.]